MGNIGRVTAMTPLLHLDSSAKYSSKNYYKSKHKHSNTDEDNGREDQPPIGEHENRLVYSIKCNQTSNNY